MGIFRVCAVALCMSFAWQPASAQDKVEVSAAQAAAIRTAVERGRLLQIYDQAAWITTDDMLKKLPKERWAEVGGWVVTPAAQGVHIDYIGKQAHAIQAIFSADVIDGKISAATVHPADAMPVLSDLARRMQNALTIARAELAKHEKWGMCANRMPNSVTLPPQADGTISVYLMTPQVKTGEIPFGGHYRVDVAADGTVRSARNFTNSCLTLPMAAKGTEAPLGLFMSHILDPQPTEIHVFQQMAAKMPVYVMTTSNELMWDVQNGQITLAGPAPKEAR